jgi:cysteinyl-tRNA synthetase
VTVDLFPSGPDGPPVLRIAGTRLAALGRARVYVCGITPYDTTHVGHAATFLWTDAAARVLRMTGCEVDVCRNVTDVDDSLLAEARRRGVSWRGLATQQTYRFERDMEALGVVRPTYEPRSHDHVEEVVALAAELLARDVAYVREGCVYFRGAGVHEAAGLDRDEALTLAAAHGGYPDDERKNDPLDAALWVRSEGDEPAWSSPWGSGRPGWHAECTAMALAMLGSSVDLHAGGAELAFPHHAYEAAQAEAFTGVRPFARTWMRAATVRYQGEKMAKSTGNLVFVKDVLDRWPAAALRLLVLSRPWAEPWDFDEAGLESAAAALDRLYSRASVGGAAGSAPAEVGRALLDDLDIPRALAVAEEAGGDVVRELAIVLGLRTREAWW